MNERELFLDWFDAANNYELQHDYGRGCKDGWQAGRAPLLKRIEELSVMADCNRCENRGKVNGCSHESYCEGCKHHYRGLRDFYKRGTEK